MTASPDIDRPPLAPGDVVWLTFDPTRGREQSGHRPAVVVASADYLEVIDTLAIVVPVTGRDRGWPNHIRLTGQTGISTESWAMTEQIRTVARDRITSVSGRISAECVRDVRAYLADFLAT